MTWRLGTPQKRWERSREASKDLPLRVFDLLWVWAMCMPGAHGDRKRGYWTPWNWRYGCLWAAMWLLGTEFWSSAEAATAFNYCTIFWTNFFSPSPSLPLSLTSLFLLFLLSSFSLSLPSLLSLSLPSFLFFWTVDHQVKQLHTVTQRQVMQPSLICKVRRWEEGCGGKAGLLQTWQGRSRRKREDNLRGKSD